MERPNSDSIHQSHERRVKLNVGGKHFETRASTLLSAGPDSLLAALSGRPNDEDPIFIDRDPEIFSVILSLLRTNRLPSSSTRFSKQELADESLYYGVESLLKSAISPPPLSGVDASLVDTIRPAAEAFPTAFTASAVDDGSVWIAHGGGQVSAYDWNLIHTGTIRTHLEEITSIRRVWPDVTAVGSNANTDSDSSGLHFYNLSSGRQIGSVHWIDSSDPRIYKARVWSITDSSDSVFASVDCFHRENCILEVDKTTLQIASEFGRLPGNSTKNTVPTKLIYLQGSGSIMSSAVSSGAFGYSGFIRLWDPRKREMVWETSEPGGSGRSSRFGDSFADMDVDVDESLMFKVCSKSGDLAMADLRYLREDPWVYLEERNPSLRNTGGGENSVVHCYRKQVFVGRKETGMEVWSRVLRKDVKEEQEEEELRDPNCYRRNFVDKEDERGRITVMEGGGERLFVSREGVEGLQVWETSNICGGPVSVL